MTPEDFAVAHAAAFPDSPGRWSADAIGDLMDSGRGLILARNGALALGRLTGDEAELLTIATAPDDRRRGAGRAVLAAFEAAAADRGAVTAVLEVALSNTPARALYAAAGYGQVGLRPGYYKDAAGWPEAALTLRKSLAPRVRDGDGP